MGLTAEQRAYVAGQRVARLATAGADGWPHAVPICFVLDGDCLYTPVDEKPKRVQGRSLRRVRNIEENAKAAVVVDSYGEDWPLLRWVMLRGAAAVVEGGEEHARAVALLREKYAQYRAMALEERPVLRVTIERVTEWRGDGRGG
ncbi:MAG: TIGR03668 family PPOX class F420-dependent oxidoreductase [Dehalococcoidia bacterium]|nr:TIGR03668 family PPOX class F420-dependent oxidoreductase [Dehalococcoidia bacterium]